MIGLTRLSGEPCHLDPDHVERVEGGFDTVVVTTDGSHYCVRETVDQVIGRIVEDRAGALAACYVLERGADADPLHPGRRDVPGEGHGSAPVLPFRRP